MTHKIKKIYIFYYKTIQYNILYIDIDDIVYSIMKIIGKNYLLLVYYYVRGSLLFILVFYNLIT